MSVGLLLLCYSLSAIVQYADGDDDDDHDDDDYDDDGGGGDDDDYDDYVR